MYAEQGLGDTLQFVRYAPLVRAGGGRVILQCQDALLPLLARTPGIDTLVGHSASPPAFDVYAPLLSLPGLLGTTLSNIGGKWIPFGRLKRMGLTGLARKILRKAEIL